MRCSEPIHRYNPELTIEWLESHCIVHDEFLDLLEIDHSIIRNNGAEYVIPVSLYDVNTKSLTGLAKNDGDKFKTRYLAGLIKNVKDLNRLRDDVAVELFVDPSLADLVADDWSLDCDRVNVHVMKRPSLGNTGMYWRLLLPNVLDGRRCERAIQLDVDHVWRDHWGLLKNHFPVAPLFYGRKTDVFDVCGITLAKKYTPISGGAWSYDPKDITFNVSNAVARFWDYCCMTLALIEPKNEYNQPCAGHPNGFGNTWNAYGSDERFLAKVMYYHLARKGALNIAMHEASVYHEPERANIDFITRHGGKVVYV